MVTRNRVVTPPYVAVILRVSVCETDPGLKDTTPGEAQIGRVVGPPGQVRHVLRRTPGEKRRRPVTLARVLAKRAQCSAISILIVPVRASSGSSALPMMQPGTILSGSAFIAWPGVGLVVRRSPTLIAP